MKVLDEMIQMKHTLERPLNPGSTTRDKDNDDEERKRHASKMTEVEEDEEYLEEEEDALAGAGETHLVSQPSCEPFVGPSLVSSSMRYQPWIILLTGAVVVAHSWVLIQYVVITAGVSFVIYAWWYIFLYSYPKDDMKAMMAAPVEDGQLAKSFT